LIIYLDGLIFGEHHVLCAVGVDAQGHKHVLGLASGASENAASATSLLEDLAERSVDPKRRYLFVIDGSKALSKLTYEPFILTATTSTVRGRATRKTAIHRSPRAQETRGCGQHYGGLLWHLW